MLFDQNKESCERLIKERKPDIFADVEFKYENKTEIYPICEKMPVITTKNIKELNIFNSMEFKIRQIQKVEDEYLFTVNCNDFSEEEFVESSIPAFCLFINIRW